MTPLRAATFIAALLVCLAITFWPPLLYGGGETPGHGVISLIFIGLCAGIVFGSGILRKSPRPLQQLCAAAAWVSIAAVVALSLR